MRFYANINSDGIMRHGMVLELAKGKLPVFVFILSLYLHIFISCGHVMLKDYAEISRMLQKAHPKNPCTAAAEV